MDISSGVVGRMIDLALEEDLGRGDVTTRLTVPEGARAAGLAIARHEIVVSGMDVFSSVLRRVDPDVAVEVRRGDGEAAAPGDVLAVAAGRTASLLAGERTALNFLQRLSGVATLTRDMVRSLPPGSAARVSDTRKTTPGLRALEKRAVLHGGGQNHRPDLAGGILIKENHAAAAGSIAAAVERCRRGAPHGVGIEVEVRTEAELLEAVESGADAVLLDNMEPPEIARCVEIAAGRVLVEASGGIGLDNAAEIAATGVDVISVGALTHSAPAVDISFLLEGAQR